MELDELCPTALLALECECRFRDNLSALAQAAPHLADLVVNTPLIVTYLARARDGSTACRLDLAGGDRQWVGGGVVPRWAAAQMIESLGVPEFGHLFFAPFDGGHALNALVEATNEHQHILVLERDAELFAGTLMVTDVSAALRSGRVQCFVGPGSGRRAAEFILSHALVPRPKHLVTASTDGEMVEYYRHEVTCAERVLDECGDASEAA